MRARIRQRGAALLLAMLVLTLVATAAAAMVWHQHRAIEVEAAERGRVQAALVLTAAFDWVGRSALRSSGPLPPPLQEARLSEFLAADQDRNTENVLDAFISGFVIDAQARYNLRNLVGNEGKPNPAELAGFRRLCEAIGIGQESAQHIAETLVAAWSAPGPESPLPPTRLEHLAWLDVDPETIARLERYAVILPQRTAVNAARAEREVLLAAIDGLDLASADRIARQGPKDLGELRSLLPAGVTSDDARVGIGTRFFEVTGAIRLGERVLAERVLIERRPGEQTVVLRRERLRPPRVGG